MKAHSGMLETACREFEEDLVIYYYGDGFEAERQRVEKHLQGCFRCQRFLDDLRKLLPQMAQQKEFPQEFWAKYYDEMMGKINAYEERRSWWREFLTPMRLWMVPAFGTAAVAIMAFALVLGKGATNSHSDRPVEKIPAEIMADVNQLEFFKSMDMLESLRLLESLDRTNADAKRS